nr:hypothetical protein [Bacteroides intestinalis]
MRNGIRRIGIFLALALITAFSLLVSGCDSTPSFSGSVSREDIEETALRLTSLEYDLSQFTISAEHYTIDSEEKIVDGENVWKVDVYVWLVDYDREPTDEISCKVELTHGLNNGEWAVIESNVNPR